MHIKQLQKHRTEQLAARGRAASIPQLTDGHSATKHKNIAMIINITQFLMSASRRVVLQSFKTKERGHCL